ncbi:hypothetical protein [Roseobacter litoralis]|uniref:hypothetical protein n=1 Tax=Roseobacter litoralis TaxID=42443 RepID=UPI002494664C|nr:hypothetical protein [Roseobacter litoralis]
MPWELTHRIALEVTEDEWEAGQSVVAEKIAKIRKAFDAESNFERPDTVPALENQKLVQHVTQLLASPEMTALSAEGTAELLERAIREYLNGARVNCLPEALQHLDKLPPVFRTISRLVKSNERTETKAEHLIAEITRLNTLVARLEADLKIARTKSVQVVFTQSALKAAGTAFGAGAVTALGLSMSHFFGTLPTDLTLENFRGWLNDLQSASPVPSEIGKEVEKSTKV